VIRSLDRNKQRYLQLQFTIVCVWNRNILSKGLIAIILMEKCDYGCVNDQKGEVVCVLGGGEDAARLSAIGSLLSVSLANFVKESIACQCVQNRSRYHHNHH
jgi:hypothetical protein